MRLIDADALAEAVVYSPNYTTGQVDLIHDALDAAPTICCERCEHDQYCYRTLEWHILEGRRDKHYPRACDLFQPQDEAERDETVGTCEELQRLLSQARAEVADLSGKNIDLEVWRASAVKRAEQAEAEAALRDRMLRDIIERIALTPERWNGWTTEEVLADLRARAEKEAER